jgi:putative membrane protein
MKNIFKIYTRDLKKIFTNSMAIILAVGILVLPSLYAWFNIYANWDPYGKQSTGNMQVAVIIEDKGTKFQDIEVNVGEQIKENLSANDVIDWQFVSKEDGIYGVKAGKYYAAIEVPADFSESLTSIVSAEFTLPQITYYANEKKNAIATKITDKVVQTVQTEVNESFVQTVVDVINEVLGVVVVDANNGSDSTVKKITTGIEVVKNNVVGLQATLKSFDTIMQQLENLDSSLSQSDISKLMNNVDSAIKNTNEAIQVTRVAVDGVTDAMGSVITQSSSTLVSAANSITEINDVANNATTAGLKTVQASVKDVNQKLSLFISTLESIRDSLETPVDGLDKLIASLTEAKNSLTQLDNRLTTIISTGANQNDVSEVTNSLKSIASTLDGLNSTYTNTVKPALSKAIDSLLTVMNDVSNVIEKIGGSDEFKNLSSSLSTSISAGSTMFSALSSMLDGFVAQLDVVDGKVAGLTDTELFNVIYNLSVNNGNELGSFLASPVTVNTEKIYGIDNYGSAMAPFYTTLAIWVGAIILIAVVNPNVKHKKEFSNLTSSQEYFGRALTYMSFGLIQSLIICLGDLYFLKIQCYNPGLFILAGCFASLVFSLFMYSLVAAFGDIGKAVAVILLVVQLGGSGGTFPIDVTPAFFRAIHPYLPFTFVINAMRECVCGVWENDYWMDLVKLCAYIVIALIVGLFFRFIFKKPIKFFNKKIEKTDLF